MKKTKYLRDSSHMLLKQGKGGAYNDFRAILPLIIMQKRLPYIRSFRKWKKIDRQLF